MILLGVVGPDNGPPPALRVKVIVAAELVLDVMRSATAMVKSGFTTLSPT